MANNQKMAGLSANVKGNATGPRPAPQIIKDKVISKGGNSSNGAKGIIHDYTPPAGLVRAGKIHSTKMGGLSSNGGSKQGKSC